MQTYKIEIEIKTDAPPKWILPAIEECLEVSEEVVNFTYNIDEVQS